MSKCLRKAAEQAYTPAEAAKLRKESQEHFDKFLKEKPDHPDAIAAQVWWAGFISDEAMAHRWKAHDPRLSAEQKAEERAQALAGLEKAKPLFAAAAEKFRKLIADGEEPRENARTSRASGRKPASKPSFATTTWPRRSRARTTRSARSC